MLINPGSQNWINPTCLGGHRVPSKLATWGTWSELWASLHLRSGGKPWCIRWNGFIQLSLHPRWDGIWWDKDSRGWCTKEKPMPITMGRGNIRLEESRISPHGGILLVPGFQLGCMQMVGIINLWGKQVHYTMSWVWLRWALLILEDVRKLKQVLLKLPDPGIRTIQIYHISYNIYIYIPVFLWDNKCIYMYTYGWSRMHIDVMVHTSICLYTYYEYIYIYLFI